MGTEGTLSPQKLPCVPLWFPSFSSANHITPIASVSPSLTDFLFSNKLVKSVKYVEYTAQLSGGREEDYFQRYFTLYAKQPLAYNLVDC